MRKIYFLFLPFLASFSSFVSGCGADHEATEQGTQMIGFGFFGGVFSILAAIILVLSFILIKKMDKKK